MNVGFWWRRWWEERLETHLGLRRASRDGELQTTFLEGENVEREMRGF